MPTIKFTADAEYDVADDLGKTTSVKIKAGTVMENVKEGTAARWERRGKAVRVPSLIERALGPVPPMPAMVEAPVPPMPAVPLAPMPPLPVEPPTPGNEK